MRDSKAEKDASMLAGNSDALREAKRKIDLAVAEHDLAAVRHWTSVWFKLQEITPRPAFL